MRSKKLTAGAALAASGAVALLLAAFATGASESQAQAPVGSTRHPRRSRSAVSAPARRHRYPIEIGVTTCSVPGIDFTTSPAMVPGLLRLRQRQRWHQWPVDRGSWYNEPARTRAAGRASARKLNRDRQGRRRSSVGLGIIECATNARMLQGEGLLRDRRGVPAECFGIAQHRRGQHGPGLHEHRCREALVRAGDKHGRCLAPP